MDLPLAIPKCNSTHSIALLLVLTSLATMSFPVRKTQDGYSWTRATGMRKGDLVCRGVVEPRYKKITPAGHSYDAIVIGAGYAGLMAARDLTDRGMFKVNTGSL